MKNDSYTPQNNFNRYANKIVRKNYNQKNIENSSNDFNKKL